MKEKIDWAEINERWLRSGLSQKKYCEQEGVGYFKFCLWRSKQIKSGNLKKVRPVIKEVNRNKKERTKTNQSDVGCSFIPVVTQELSSKRLSNSESCIEILLPHGICLRIPVDEASTK